MDCNSLKEIEKHAIDTIFMIMMDLNLDIILCNHCKTIERGHDSKRNSKIIMNTFKIDELPSQVCNQNKI